MIDLPPLVSKGSPIRAADQNKLITAVRSLAGASVAGAAGGNMQRSRAKGKKRPFEVSVLFDAERGVAFARVEPGVWHGNRKTVPAGITYENSQNEGPDTWIVAEKDEETGMYKASEILLPSPGYIVLRASLIDGFVAKVELAFSADAPARNDPSAEELKTVVAYVDFIVSNGVMEKSTVLQYLGGDFWLGEKGGDSGESYEGNPYAWTRVGPRKWQLSKVCVMVVPNQLFGFNKTTKKELVFWRCVMPAEFTEVKDTSTQTLYDSAPHAPNRFWVQDGIAIAAGEGYPEDEYATIIYAEILSRGGTASLNWRAQVLRNSEWSFPWVPQNIVTSVNFDAMLRSLNSNTMQHLVFSQDLFIDDGRAGEYRVVVPMAIVAPEAAGGNPSLVPIRHGMIEVRPNVAIGIKPDRGTEFDSFVISKTDCSGYWDCSGHVVCSCLTCGKPYGSGIESLDLLDAQ
jgi:hypothetical protein